MLKRPPYDHPHGIPRGLDLENPGDVAMMAAAAQEDADLADSLAGLDLPQGIDLDIPYPHGSAQPFLEVDPIQVTFDEALSLARGKETWRLVAPVRMRDGLGAALTIPAGFETDLASVPRILWPFFPPYGFHLRAAIVHDYLYARRTIVDRGRADAIFLAIMLRYGVRPWRARAMYLAVRLFGAAAWGR
jgi:hypothetical protein